MINGESADAELVFLMILIYFPSSSLSSTLIAQRRREKVESKAILRNICRELKRREGGRRHLRMKMGNGG